VGLGGDEPGMARKFYHLHDAVVWRQTGELHAVFGQGIAEVVVDLVAVSVALVDGLCAVQLIGEGVFIQNAGIGAQP